MWPSTIAVSDVVRRSRARMIWAFPRRGFAAAGEASSGLAPSALGTAHSRFALVAPRLLASRATLRPPNGVPRKAWERRIAMA